MAKKKGGASPALQDGEASTTTKHEHPLQAILLADISSSDQQRFLPLSLDRPKALCPLNNVPLIEYSLAFLAASGVQEVFVVCASTAVENALQEYSSSHNGGDSSTSLQVTVIQDASLTNAGDALREMEKRNLVQSDPFLLLFSDVITNANVASAIQAHKLRKKRDSSAIMTLLFKPVGATRLSCDHEKVQYSKIRAVTDNLVVGVDPTHENRILIYNNNNHHHSTSNNNTTIPLPCSFFASHPHIELHGDNDWLDCGIDICSYPDVLARISDEFDYRDLRKEFVSNSVAEEEEGLQNKMYAHVLQSNEYAARVVDFYTYAHISRDVLTRWCWPVVPDSHCNHLNVSKCHHRYERQPRQYMYLECSNNMTTTSSAASATTTRVARSSKIRGVGMIGSSCWIGPDCIIEHCVLGHFCHVAKGATISHSHIWDSVQIGAGATVLHSILGDGCTIEAGAVVNRGCVLGAGVVVGKGVVLPEFTRLTIKEEQQDEQDDDWSDEDDEDEDDEDEDSGDEDEDENEQAKQDKKNEKSSPRETTEIVSDVIVVGPDGKGRVWVPTPEYNDDADDNDNDAYFTTEEKDHLAHLVKARSIGFDPTEMIRKRLLLQLQEDDDDLSEDDDEDAEMMEHVMDNDFGAYADGPVTFEMEPVSTNTAITAAPAVIIGRQKGVDVIRELKLICLEYEPTSPIENLAIELNSFKFSQNATYADCTMAATLAILEKMNIGAPGSSSTAPMSDGKLVADFKSSLEHWAPLLRKMSIGLEEEKAIVLAIEQCATSDTNPEMSLYLSTGTSFRFLLQTLHDEEIVSEDAILSWAAERRAQQQQQADNGNNDEPEDATKAAVAKLFQLQPVQDFLEWLAEESEDDDEDDEDEDEDD